MPLALGPLVNSTQYLAKILSNLNNTAYISVDAKGPFGAIVNYPLPAAMNSNNGRFIPVCTPPSGSTFPIGETVVKCTGTASWSVDPACKYKRVNPLAKLTINRTDTTWLKITNHDNVPNFISISGDAKIDGVKI